MDPRKIALRLAAILLFAAISSPAIAQDKQELFGRRFDLSMGAYWPRMSAELRVDSTEPPGIGTTINFDTLGLEKMTTGPLVLGGYQFSRRSSIRFAYFDIDQNAQNVPTGIEIRIGDIVIPIDTVTSSTVATKVFAVEYGYSFINDNKKNFGLSFGLNVQDFNLRINNEEDPTEPPATADTVAPLPTLGAFGGFRLGKKWDFSGRLGVFALEVGEYKGTLTNLSAAVIHRTFKNVGFGAGYYGFWIDVDSEDESWKGKFEFNYSGPVAFIRVYF
jgi:hypothetical protein